MTHRLFRVITAGVFALVGIALLLRPNPVIPPEGNGLRAVQGPALNQDARIEQIAQALRDSDGIELRLLAASNDELDLAEQYNLTAGATVVAEREALSVLGEAYVHAYAAGTELVVLATEHAELDSATVVVIPYSRKELLDYRAAVITRFEDAGLSSDQAHADLRFRRGAWVSVCAPEDSGVDLSDFPADAVHYRGPCRG